MSEGRHDLTTVAGRMAAEGERLGLSSTEMSALALSAFAKVGADVLYITTGMRGATVPASQEALVAMSTKQALALLDPAERRRLLLELVAEELRK